MLMGCAGSSLPVYSMLPQYEGEHLGADATIRYVDTPLERERMRLRVVDGRLVDADGEPLDPKVDTHPHRDGFAIFVMDQRRNIYVSFDHQQGRFHHSSLLAGAPVTAAGDMTILDGRLLAISNSSGHYRPGPECIDVVLAQLRTLGVAIDGIRISRIGADGQKRPYEPKARKGSKAVNDSRADPGSPAHSLP